MNQAGPSSHLPSSRRRQAVATGATLQGIFSQDAVFCGVEGLDFCLYTSVALLFHSCLVASASLDAGLRIFEIHGSA